MRTSILAAALLVPVLGAHTALAQEQPPVDGADGYVKVNPSSATTATGTVVVHSPASGEVITQNLALSNPPREHRGRVTDGGSATLQLPPGQWKVGVEFDSGGGDYREVRVDPAFRAEVTLQTWQLARSGTHFGFMLYGAGVYSLDASTFGGGPIARGFANISGSGSIDFQFGGQVGARFEGGASSLVDPVIEASLTADFLWNTAGGIYRPYVGGRIGGWFGDFVRCNDVLDANLACSSGQVQGSALPAFALEASLLHFTLGSRRNFDIDFGQDVTFLLDTIGGEDAKLFIGLNLGVGAVFY